MEQYSGSMEGRTRSITARTIFQARFDEVGPVSPLCPAVLYETFWAGSAALEYPTVAIVRTVTDIRMIAVFPDISLRV